MLFSQFAKRRQQRAVLYCMARYGKMGDGTTRSCRTYFRDPRMTRSLCALRFQSLIRSARWSFWNRACSDFCPLIRNRMVATCCLGGKDKKDDQAIVTLARLDRNCRNHRHHQKTETQETKMRSCARFKPAADRYCDQDTQSLMPHTQGATFAFYNVR